MRTGPSRAFSLRAAFGLVGLTLAVTGPVFGFAYEYEQYVFEDRTVAALRCTDIYLPKAVKLEWTYEYLNPSDPATFEVRRRVGANTWVLGTTTNKYWVDSGYDWTWDNTITYDVRVKDDAQPSMGLPAPPPIPDGDVYMPKYTIDGSWVTITVVPKYLTAAANQTVDSRLDLRYGTNVHKDFQFGSRIYRGGLFCGYANDPSRVGRSFIGFTIPEPNNNVFYWTGSLNVYHTRNAATGTATVGIHEVSDSWTENGTVWSNAPSLTPGSPLSSQSIAWDSGSPVSSWKHFNVEEPFGLALVGDGALTLALAATNEATNAWAYFAKTQWDANYGPRVVYATGAASAPLELTASPNPVTGGSNSTGTVYINGFRTNASVVTLSSSNPSVASVPSSVTVEAGDISKTFTITTYTVGSSTPVTITASRNGYSETATLTVNP